MNVQQLQQAMQLASQKEGVGNFDGLEIFSGFGLKDFTPVHCTLMQVAKLLVWQALQFNGEWNAEELDQVAHYGRKRFLIIGVGC